MNFRLSVRRCLPKYITSAVFFPALLFPLSAGAVSATNAHTMVEFIAEDTSIRPGYSFWVALHMQMEKDWHTYWKNPGDAGLATSIQWTLPDGFHADAVQWPSPEQIKAGPLVSYGYEGEIFLLTQIHPPDNLTEGESILLKGQVNWLACKIECIPGAAGLVLRLPVREEIPEHAENWSSVFTKAREALPKPWSDFFLAVEDQGEHFVLRWQMPDSSSVALAEAVFFPDRGDLIDHAAVPELTTDERGYALAIKKSSLTVDPPDKAKEIKGILVLARKGKEKKEAWELAVPVVQPAEKETAVVQTPPVPAAGPIEKSVETAPVAAEAPVMFPLEKDVLPIPLGVVIVFAFLGGIILNLMPCVLPVLSLKILNVVQQSKNGRSQIRQHGFLFTFGVMISFWILAGIMLLIKSAGTKIGWGFQFQSPVFVALLAVLFFILSVDFFGVLEMGTALPQWTGTVRPSSGKWGSFLSGVLATVAATPCTAPFMGTAIGAALAQPAYVALAIFSFLGLGMAYPFLIITLFPEFLSFVPKPGPWMERLKQGLGFPLMATVVWLGWVLGNQLGVDAMAILFTGLLMMGTGLWALGGRQRAAQKRGIALPTALSFISVGLFFAGQATSVVPVNPTKNPVASTIVWQEY